MSPEDKSNQASVSTADRVIQTLGSTDNAVDVRVGISLSTSETMTDSISLQMDESSHPLRLSGLYFV